MSVGIWSSGLRLASSGSVYREEGLSVRRRRSRKRAIGTRAPLVTEARANGRWSVDFVQDQFADGHRFRILNMIDDVTVPRLV